jgi:hypothetical protein
MVLVWVVFRLALGVRLPTGRLWSELAAWSPVVLPAGLF